jgi:Tol biopolymer transport system component
MRSVVSITLLATITLVSGCAPNDTTAPRPPSLGPSMEVVNSFGPRIAFTSRRDSGNDEIYVMNPDGSGQTRLTMDPAVDEWPNWSSDAKMIVFTRWQDRAPQIYVMAADGSGQTRLTDGPSRNQTAAWSPDGKRIAFSSDRDGGYSEIYVMNADGSGQTRLTYDAVPVFSPAWSPDGRQIVVSKRERIWVIAADGSAQTQLTSGWLDFHPVWSPDGNRIAFSRYQSSGYEIYVMGADGSALTRLTNSPGVDDFGPSWSPDGTEIVFSSNRDGSRELYVMNADGSNVRRLTNNDAADEWPTWGPPPDLTPPQLTLPPVPYTIPATRWFGTFFGYDVSATDDRDPNPTVTCTPPSPNTFPIGTNEVNCTATDRSGNVATGSFLVSVWGPYEELGNVATTLESLIASRASQGLPTDEQEAAVADLQGAREQLARTPPNRSHALGKLQGAARELEAALREGQLSQFGYGVLVQNTVHAARIAADQAIAEAVARGESEEAVAKAREAFAAGDSLRAAGQFKDAIHRYKKACDAVRVD